MTDQSFKSVTEALVDGYMLNYPDTKVNVVVKKEDIGFLDLLKDKAKLIVMSRELSQAEKAEYEKQSELKFQPAKFAADAVVFVVPRASSLENLSQEEIISGLQSADRRFIFDGTNSGNLNFVAQTIGRKPSELKFSTLGSNEAVITQLNRFPGKVGVVGLNIFSRPYDKKSQELLNSVKVLPIVKNGKAYAPTIQNIRSMDYPFTRILYFLTREGNFNLANGIIRFSCTQLGQLIVEKEGLQPYNMFRREVEMK